MTSGARGRGAVTKANVAQASAPELEPNTMITDADKSTVSGISGEQWRTLANLLNDIKLGATEKLTGKRNFVQWIIDTGASHHMTGKLEYLTDVKNVLECLVGFPDGMQNFDTKEGTMVLSDTLKLSSVLYVPSLKCNLISVSQLIDELNCMVQFTDKFYVIQDHISRMVIGASGQREGLYYLQGIAIAAAVKSDGGNIFYLWHERLGHPSPKVVELIPNIGSRRSNALCDKACNVCLRAKQCRESFPISINKTMDNFQLIHCDLWGPYRTISHCGARYFLTIVDDYSRAVSIYPLEEKKEVFTHVSTPCYTRTSI